MNYPWLMFKYWFPNILLEGFLRYFLIVGGLYLAFWVVGARKFRHRLIQNQWPSVRHAWREFGYSLSTVLIIALTGFFVLANQSTPFKIYQRVDQHGGWYWGLSLVLILLAHDAYFYWTHRLMHHPRLYGFFHRVHHLSLNPSPWATYAFSPWEAAVHAAFLPLYLLVFPTHLLVIVLFLYHMVFRNAMQHLGFELFPPGFTAHPFWGWNSTTTHHSLHHTNFNCNYGFYFTFWDRAMKTLDRDYDSFYEKVTREKPLAAK